MQSGCLGACSLTASRGLIQASGSQEGRFGSSAGDGCQYSCRCRCSTYILAGRSTREPTVTCAARSTSMVPSRNVTSRSWSRSLLSGSRPRRKSGTAPRMDKRTSGRYSVRRSFPPNAEQDASTSAHTTLPIRTRWRYSPGACGSDRSNLSDNSARPIRESSGKFLAHAGGKFFVHRGAHTPSSSGDVAGLSVGLFSSSSAKISRISGSTASAFAGLSSHLVGASARANAASCNL